MSVKGTLHGQVASVLLGPCPHFFVQDKQELGFALGCFRSCCWEKLGVEWLREFRAERFHLKKRGLLLKIENSW